MDFLSFVVRHADEIHQPDEWEKIFGIQIMDPDGFDRSDDWDRQYYKMEDFARRAYQSTIRNKPK